MLREKRIALPTFAQLAEPEQIPPRIREALAGVGPDDAHPLNLFRVHWHNGATGPASSTSPSTSCCLAS